MKIMLSRKSGHSSRTAHLQCQDRLGRCQYCGTGVTGSMPGQGGPVSVLWDWCYRVWTGWAGVSIVGLVLQDLCQDRLGRCQYCRTGVTECGQGGPVSVLWDWYYRISAISGGPASVFVTV